MPRYIYEFITYLSLIIAIMVTLTVLPEHLQNVRERELLRRERYCSDNHACGPFEYQYDYLINLPSIGLSPNVMIVIGMWLPFLYPVWLAISLVYFKMHPELYTHRKNWWFIGANLVFVFAIFVVGDAFLFGLGNAN